MNNDPQIIYGPILKSPSTENAVQRKPIKRHRFQYCLFISHNVARNMRVNAEPYFTSNIPLWYSIVSDPKLKTSNNPIIVSQIDPVIPISDPRILVSFIRRPPRTHSYIRHQIRMVHPPLFSCCTY
jgi:hypothetical protein